MMFKIIVLRGLYLMMLSKNLIINLLIQANIMLIRSTEKILRIAVIKLRLKSTSRKTFRLKMWMLNLVEYQRLRLEELARLLTEGNLTTT